MNEQDNEHKSDDKQPPPVEVMKVDTVIYDKVEFSRQDKGRLLGSPVHDEGP